jgi:hypothetical protein
MPQLSNVCRCFLVLAASASLPLSTAAAGQVWVVAPAAGPGVDFTNLQTAITSAANGDVLLLKSGSYSTGTTSPFQCSGKGLTLVEDAGHTATLTSPFSFFNVAIGQMACLRNIDVIAADAGVALSLNGCGGSIWIEGCTVTASSTIFPFLPAGEGLRASNCADVKLTRCSMTGASITTSLGAGLAGVLANSSNLALYDCTCKGGDGSNGAAVLSGGDGATVNGGFLYASGTTFVGGKGGNGGPGGSPFTPCTNGSAGGHGLHISGAAPSAATLACAFIPGSGGAAGSGGTCVPGVGGSTVKVDSGTYTPLAGTAHSLVCSPTCREGQTFTLTFTGVPGELVIVDLGGFQGFTYFPDFRGVLVLGFPLFTLVQGTLPASGTLVKSSSVINPLGATTEGVTLYLQSAYYSAANGLFQAGPSATVLLDSSL